MKTLKQIIFAFSMFSCFISLRYEAVRFLVLACIVLNFAVIVYSFIA
jgi:hypothetical protein